MMLELLAIQNQYIADIETTRQSAFIRASDYGRPSGSYSYMPHASVVGEKSQFVELSLDTTALSSIAADYKVGLSVPKQQRSVTEEEDAALWAAMESSSKLVSRGRLVL